MTRNTTESVDAFFSLIGEEWRAVFDPVLTREFKYVKPDKRALAHFAEVGNLFRNSVTFLRRETV